ARLSCVGFPAAQSTPLIATSRTFSIVDPGGVVVNMAPDGKVLGSLDVGADAEGASLSGTTLWVTSAADGTVSRVDDAGSVTTIPVGHQPTGVIVDCRRCWGA